ncbi:hypothetical protein AB0I52_07660 [Streptomyces sp. NPDC050423]|uniref:hypothetical protein n=1 Tax=Streptomyces sp. NPDC050423 TaxID=3155402 RepID=UPI0034392096
MVEEIIDCALACGLTPGQAVRAYRTIRSYVYGDLVFRRAADRRAEHPPSKRYFPDVVTDADAAELPRLTAIKDDWRAYAAYYDVVDELDAIVTGLLTRGTRSASGAPAG